MDLELLARAGSEGDVVALANEIATDPAGRTAMASALARGRKTHDAQVGNLVAARAAQRAARMAANARPVGNGDRQQGIDVDVPTAVKR